jgi:hypothetical protein
VCFALVLAPYVNVGMYGLDIEDGHNLFTTFLVHGMYEI